MHPSQIFCLYFGTPFCYYLLGLKYFRETFVKPEDVVAQKVGVPPISLSFAIYYYFFLLFKNAFDGIITDAKSLFIMHWFQIVVTKDSTRGVHFRRAGPREKVSS